MATGQSVLLNFTVRKNTGRFQRNTKAYRLQHQQIKTLSKELKHKSEIQKERAGPVILESMSTQMGMKVTGAQETEGDSTVTTRISQIYRRSKGRSHWKGKAKAGRVMEKVIPEENAKFFLFLFFLVGQGLQVLY